MVCISLSVLPSSSPPTLPSTSDSFNSFTTSCRPRLRRITPRRKLRALPVEFRARPVKEDDDDGEGTTSVAKFTENNSIADFMRFKRGGSAGGDKGNGELQTAVVSYRKKFPWSLLWPFLQVDLVSTIHIADKEYFTTIQRELELYDCVLYEMVASRESLENRMNPNSSKRHQSSRYRGFNILGFIQRQMARILTLDFQLDCLDYESENWYHADLDFETFKLLQQEKGESFFTFARDMTLRSTEAMIQPASMPEDLSPWRSKLLWASRVLPMPLVGLLIIGSVCADPGSPTSEYPELEALSMLDFGAAMKVFLARRLTSEFKLVTADVEEKSVIIGERNRAAIDELRRAIDDGYRRIAILYGGGHMPDLGRRLREEFDLVPTQVQWITAWSIMNRNTKLSQVPLLQKMAELSGWPLNRYQTLALLIFSSVLAIDLWFWELFFGTAVSWVSQLPTEVAFYLDNLQGVDKSLLCDPLLLQDHNNGGFPGDVDDNKKTTRFESRGDYRDPEIYEVAGGGNPSRLNRYALWGSILASTNSVLLGYDIGVMSGAILYIREDMKITSTEVEVLVGSLNVVSLLGSLAAGRTSDNIGRRLTILLAAVTFLVGAVLMGLAPSFPFLMAGRLVAGIGVGYALMIAPVYAAEISPATTRGFMSSLPEVFINVGILLGYVSNYALSGLPSDISWRLMLGLAALPAVVIGFGIMAMPESPRWLVMEGRLEEARRVLVKISESEEDAEFRLSEMVNYASFSPDNRPRPGPCQWTRQGIWKELLWKPSRPIRRILVAAIGVNFFMQASGNDAVIYYSPEVFREAGISNQKHLVGVTVIMGFMKTFFVLVSATYLDRFGRRPLLLVGSIGMAVSLFGLGLGSKFLELSGSDKPGWVIGMCVVAVCADVSFFSIGLGPITWVYSSEIFPTRLRAQGTSLAISVNRLVSGVVSMSFLSVSKETSFGVMFMVLSGIMGLAALFIYFSLPETKGKSLEEIEALFEDKQ